MTDVLFDDTAVGSVSCLKLAFRNQVVLTEANLRLHLKYSYSVSCS